MKYTFWKLISIVDDETPAEGETEVIFSLDGLGLLGFEAVVKRDYPLMFGTLYFFTLLGLLMGIIGDIMYHIVDPRIDFEARDV